jgi:hypothetical protein
MELHSLPRQSLPISPKQGLLRVHSITPSSRPVRIFRGLNKPTIPGLGIGAEQSRVSERSYDHIFPLLFHFLVDTYFTYSTVLSRKGGPNEDKILIS